METLRHSLRILILEGDKKDKVVSVKAMNEHFYFIRGSQLIRMVGDVPILVPIPKEQAKVVYEEGKLNSCLVEGVPCVNLQNKHRIADERFTVHSFGCRISFECGRGSCYRYEPDLSYQPKVNV